jgi:hypothetical protein
MDADERMRVRMAALRATRVFPGPVGELVSKDLLDWEQFGFRFGGYGLVARLVAAVMNAEMPAPVAV